MSKKISAILLALTMLLTMSFTVFAAGEVELEATIPGGFAIKDSVFELKFDVTGLEKLTAFGLDIVYNPTAIVPVVDAAGTPAAAGMQADTSYIVVPAAHNSDDPVQAALNSLLVMGVQVVEGDGTNTLRVSTANSTAVCTLKGTTVLTVRFKALDDVAPMNLSYTLDSLNDATGANLKESLVDNTDTSAFKVVQEPDLPTIKDDVVTITGAKEGENAVATVAYELNTGAKSGESYTDVSEIKWLVDDEVKQTKKANEADAKTFAITSDMVAKTLKVVVSPAVERTIKAANADGAKEATAVVAHKDGYKPVATKKVDVTELDITATVAVNVKDFFELDNTYANATYGATYKWYVKGEGDAWTEITEDTAIAAKEVAVFGADWIDKVVKVEVTPTVKVGETTTPGDVLTIEGTVGSEPPVLTIDTAKLAKKKIYAGSNFKISDVTATSKAPEGTAKTVTIAYTWYIVDAKDAETFDPLTTKDTPAGTGESLAVPKDTKEAPVIGKKVFVKIVATDALNVSTTDSYAFPEAIAKKPASGSTQTGASLVTGGNTVITPEKPEDTEKPGTEEPGTDVPGTEEPGVSEDPAGTANENGAAAFTDVNKEAYAWAYDSIDVLAKAGVIKGMTETTFGPELTTTNAQVIALAVRIAGLTAEEGATTDKVDAEHWVAGEMAIAEANAILAVYGDKIDVEGETTREIAFTLLYNALKAAGVELAETAEAIEFTDAASISEGCVEAIDALVKAGIVNGMGDGTLAPKATLTRAQLAKILGLANALIK